jgi:excisionase family DNA binding protein
MTERLPGPQDAATLNGARGPSLTVRDVARYLGMSTRWVHERVRRHEIPCYRFGAALRFDPEEVRRWTEQYRAAPEGKRRDRR